MQPINHFIIMASYYWFESVLQLPGTAEVPAVCTAGIFLTDLCYMILERQVNKSAVPFSVAFYCCR